MSLKTRVQRQSCVYWAPQSTESGGQAFDRFGNRLYADPEEKDCRWDDIAEVFVNINGVEETSRAMVMVDGILVGGLLMQGTLDDITDEAVPQNNTGAWEIKQREYIPDLKAKVYYEWAYL